MQIVHDLNFGGMQRVVADLCLNIDSSQYKMSVCCLDELGPNAKELEQNGISIHLVKKKPGIDCLLPFKLKKLFKRGKIDIVHTHGINPFFYATIGAKLARTPLTIQTDHARGTFPVSKKEMFSEMILSWFVDRLIAVSEGVKSDLVKYEHINPRKIQVIYNGIDGSQYRVNIDKKKKRKEMGIRDDHNVIGIGVRLSRQKGIQVLIEAFNHVIKSIPNTILLLIGDGEMRDELEKLTLTYGIEDKVLFTGFRYDIPELLQIIDIYALPSFWEGHPLVLLEAMATGIPIVATDIPGNRETVDHGSTGLLVPPKKPIELSKALIRLLKNGDLRKKMGNAGYKKYQDLFTLERTVRVYQNLYEKN